MEFPKYEENLVILHSFPFYIGRSLSEKLNKNFAVAYGNEDFENPYYDLVIKRNKIDSYLNDEKYCVIESKDNNSALYFIFLAENNDLRREIETMFLQNGVRIYE